MTKRIALPVLGAGGWVIDPSKLLRQLFSHALVATNQQCLIYQGNITSIHDIESTYQTNPEKLCEVLSDSLSAYYNRYFKTATVNCTYTDTGYVKYLVVISISVADETGRVYDLAIENNYDNGTLADTVKLVSGQTSFMDY